MLPALKQFGEWLIATLGPVLKQLGDFIMDTVLPALQKLGTFIVTVLMPTLAHIWDEFTAALAAAWAIVGPILEKIFTELASSGKKFRPNCSPSGTRWSKNAMGVESHLRHDARRRQRAARIPDRWGTTLSAAWTALWDVIGGVVQITWDLISGIVKIALDLSERRFRPRPAKTGTR